MYLLGYGFAYRLLFSGIGILAGFGTAELVVCLTGRSRKVGIFLALAATLWFAGLVLLLPYPGELFEAKV